MQKTKAIREEKDKKQHVKDIASLQLLLNEKLGSKDLSAFAKKLGASSRVLACPFTHSHNAMTASHDCHVNVKAATNFLFLLQ